MTLAEQWREEGLEEGLEKGRQEGRHEGSAAEAQRSVIDVLNVRFNRVPDGLAEKILHERNLTTLRNLHIQALKSSSLEDFASHIE